MKFHLAVFALTLARATSNDAASDDCGMEMQISCSTESDTGVSISCEDLAAHEALSLSCPDDCVRGIQFQIAAESIFGDNDFVDVACFPGASPYDPDASPDDPLVIEQEGDVLEIGNAGDCLPNLIYCLVSSGETELLYHVVTEGSQPLVGRDDSDEDISTADVDTSTVDVFDPTAVYCDESLSYQCVWDVGMNYEITVCNHDIEEHCILWEIFFGEESYVLSPADGFTCLMPGECITTTVWFPFNRCVYNKYEALGYVVVIEPTTGHFTSCSKEVEFP